MDELTITEADLRGWDPCYGEDRLAEVLEGVTFPISAREVLVLDGIPDKDLMWVVLRPELISDRHLREFACDCAQRAMELHGNGDPRSLEAIAVARRFAAGDATEAELAAAAGAAAGAARDARAAGAAARDAAWDAARDAAWDAAGDAAWDAAGDARDAAWAAAGDAGDAAWDARDAETKWQVARLAEVLGHG